MLCLVLELANDDSMVKDWDKDYQGAVFRRIGLARLNSFSDYRILHNILNAQEKDMELPHQVGDKGYNEAEGKHRLICIV